MMTSGSGIRVTCDGTALHHLPADLLWVVVDWEDCVECWRGVDSRGNGARGGEGGGEGGFHGLLLYRMVVIGIERGDAVGVVVEGVLEDVWCCGSGGVHVTILWWWYSWGEYETIRRAL